MITETIQSEHHRICEQLQDFQQELNQLPEGKLICTHSGNYTKWYQSTNHIKSYIPKKNRFLAEQLALKKFLSYQIQQLITEKKALEMYLRHHKDMDTSYNTSLKFDDDFYELLNSTRFADNAQIQEWLNESYETNPYHPEHLVHRTLSGLLVRSKSESIIASSLSRSNIPFRYECALTLNEQTFYPDFTILHPRTLQTYYFEHLGMLDDPVYLNKALAKLRIYAENGIYPNINLILSFETQAHPLDSSLLEKTIDHFFL